MKPSTPSPQPSTRLARLIELNPNLFLSRAAGQPANDPHPTCFRADASRGLAKQASQNITGPAALRGPDNFPPSTLNLQPSTGNGTDGKHGNDGMDGLKAMAWLLVALAGGVGIYMLVLDWLTWLAVKAIPKF
jgi:hypothetical protein